MQTPEFAGALEALTGEAKEQRLALMCAEAVPWRCHRSLIADALTVRGIPVEHIVGSGRTRPHVLTPWAAVKGTTIEYPAAPSQIVTATRLRSSVLISSSCARANFSTPSFSSRRAAASRSIPISDRRARRSRAWCTDCAVRAVGWPWSR